jgi:hypothetical protein
MHIVPHVLHLAPTATTSAIASSTAATSTVTTSAAAATTVATAKEATSTMVTMMTMTAPSIEPAAANVAHTRVCSGVGATTVPATLLHSRVVAVVPGLSGHSTAHICGVLGFLAEKLLESMFAWRFVL